MKKKGFTLIELLIVIAIIGILVAIALPSYQAHIRKSKRIDVQMAMTNMSVIAERQFARESRYPTTAILTGGKWPDTYTASISSAASSFIIKAIPIGAQASDECGTMTLNQIGETGAQSAGCW